MSARQLMWAVCFVALLALAGCPADSTDTSELDPNAASQQTPTDPNDVADDSADQSSAEDDADVEPETEAETETEDEPEADPEEEPDPLLDSDGDGLLDTFEASIGTDPNDADTDGDGLTDGQEVVVDLDPLTPDETGVVVQVHCELAITISLDDEDHLYASPSGPEDFTRWNPGDLVVVTATSQSLANVEIANATFGEIAYTIDYGAPVTSGIITDVDHFSEEIEMGGRWWPANSVDADGLWGWSAGDEALVARYPVQAETYDAIWIMLNISSCEYVLLSIYY